MTATLTRLDRATCAQALRHRLTLAEYARRRDAGTLPAHAPDDTRLFREPRPQLPSLGQRLRYAREWAAQEPRPVRYSRHWLRPEPVCGDEYAHAARLAAALGIDDVDLVLRDLMR
jgi:hypothetical protein